QGEPPANDRGRSQPAHRSDALEAPAAACAAPSEAHYAVSADGQGTGILQDPDVDYGYGKSWLDIAELLDLEKPERKPEGSSAGGGISSQPSKETRPVDLKQVAEMLC